MLKLFFFKPKGQVGRLHCSESVYNKLKGNNNFNFDPCGEEEISGNLTECYYFLNEIINLKFIELLTYYVNNIGMGNHVTYFVDKKL